MFTVSDVVESFSKRAAHRIVDILVRMPLAIVYVDANNEIVSWNETPLDDLPVEVGRLEGREMDGSIQWEIERYLDQQAWFVVPQLHTRVLAFRLRYFELPTSELLVVVHGYGG